MLKGDYDKLKDLDSRNVCAEHKAPLEVARDSPEKCYVLRCDEDHFPDALTRQLTLAEWQALRRAFPIGETKEVAYEKHDERQE